MVGFEVLSSVNMRLEGLHHVEEIEEHEEAGEPEELAASQWCMCKIIKWAYIDACICPHTEPYISSSRVYGRYIVNCRKGDAFLPWARELLLSFNNLPPWGGASTTCGTGRGGCHSQRPGAAYPRQKKKRGPTLKGLSQGSGAGMAICGIQGWAFPPR